MNQLSMEHLTQLFAERQSPCISLYQPTHRHVPGTREDPIRYRNLLKDLENSLRQKYSSREIAATMEQFQALAHDDHFWNHRTEGLAILSAPGMFQIFELQRTVAELLVVSDSFHIKPLLRILQSADRYQLLCLNRHEAKLYEGNRDALDPVELTNVPATITEALGDELTKPHLTVASYGGGGGASHHGHGGKKDEVDIDMERFFRVIDRAILEHHSAPSGLPLMLVALPEHTTPFHDISHNSFLMKNGIHANAEALSLEQLREQAWQKIEPLFIERLANLVNNFKVARSHGLASDDLAQVAQAAKAGRISVLLVEADRQVAGKLNSNGEIDFGDLAHPEVGDVIDDIAEVVLRMKGEVVVVPSERMPSERGLAAIYRY
ncbi:hypothetical protein KBI23_01595 [bacterium]|nr:hypothetical protein [bacterium]MBP9807032.1 hypothetical protein [bacterium]